MENRRKIGTAQEEKAAEYLSSRGYRILERNFRCKLGEIDLIAEESGVLVFLEVADFYRLSGRIAESQSCRFDVVAILGEEIQVYKNAFSYWQGIR